MNTYFFTLEEYDCDVCGGKAGYKLITFEGKYQTIQFDTQHCETCNDQSFTDLQAWHSIITDTPTYKPDCSLSRILYDIQDGLCIYCGNQLIDKLTDTDHIIANTLSRKRHYMTQVPSNFALACHSCNTSKYNLWYEDWIRRKFKDNAEEIIERVHLHMAIVRKETGEDKWRESMGIGDSMLFEPASD